jgi:hypothetical protein
VSFYHSWQECSISGRAVGAGHKDVSWEKLKEGR